MAQLDPLLQALVDRDAQELILSAEQRPVFRFGADLRPVSQKSLNEAQIQALLAELADKVEAAKIAGRQPVRFVYKLGGGRPFLCEVTNGSGRIGAVLKPHAAEPALAPAAAPTPAAPSPETVAAPAPQAAPPRAAARRRPGAPEIEAYLMKMVETGSSDLHLSAEEVPMLRLHGEMMRIENESVLGAERTWELLQAIMPERNRAEYEQTHDTDFAYEIEGVARFRVNIFADRKGTGAVFRIIPAEILTAEQLGLSPAILGLCQLSKGLVLVTGPTGSGKSTTLAGMIDYINRVRPDHIITIEDPIEFVHPNRTCLINQREVVSHTQGFKRALRAALREDPDIVLVGEMRDLETIAIAIETAETGHLVFGTLHTTTACSTVDRIIDQFPADRQAQIRTMLSESLRGVVSQTLLKKIGGGRVAALETLIVTPAISNLIREGKTFQIPSLMQTGKRLGMQLLNDRLLELVTQKVVEPDEAYRKAIDKTGLLSQLSKLGFKVTVAAEA